MAQLILLMSVVVSLVLGRGGAAAGQSAGVGVPLPLAPTQHVKYRSEHPGLPRMITNTQHHEEKTHSDKDTTWIPDGDEDAAINSILHKTDQDSTSQEQDGNLYSTDLTDLTEHTNSLHNDPFTASIFHKGDIATIPYDSLGWFSKTVEVAMDGSLYIGVAIGIMFVAASLLSGAIDLIGDTCLICSFIGYANTVEP